MAIFTPITSSQVVATILNGAVNPIPSLFAVRSGLISLCDSLLRQSNDVADATESADELEAAFQRACDELWRTDEAIMRAHPQSLSDIRMQMIVCRYRTSDGDFAEEHVNLLFENIERLAA
ncbi:hypothetical protein [Allomesorhizobium alhagi]|uniref:Uncharacterized protein n=1 Tax=Mesorhizobium alhagi CCNWXJ12-2 TaxID=1107882 RepID=H0HNG5_9HYPH|nr:hypothetical protein [Mesorhizobium alhagi]EHK57737.1 hypothetical protein MAXJ12_08439 [Mesorhizobium alhagi CCNWXJ12-2]